MRDDNQLAFQCGTVLSDEGGLWEELIFSRPGHLNLLAGTALLGPYGAEVPDPQRVQGQARGSALEMPDFFYDVLGGTGWVADLTADAPLIAATLEGTKVALSPQQGVAQFALSGDGLAGGMARMLDYCGMAPPAPDAAAIPPADLDPALFARAEDVLRGQCAGGDFIAGAGVYRSVDLTGDDLPDLVLNARDLTCSGGLFDGRTPGCTDGICRFDILTTQTGTPMIFYGRALEPVPGTPGAMRIFFDDATCREADRPPGCAARMRWSGDTFGSVGME
ncbi:hypothetical protein KM176_14850 [Pseudooceanicola sp. CBS1P-1]|uniref:Uncharacterized protein n=1 Tax=Pseudooceanicola albus TaxID=2692189 RepID=A0A6L7G3H8_9RHOB|nr:MULTISPECIES: hypothetical protein [Pseudooceanicola]MBT9385147.1 hypothetical protein [Pseudooceanicola endophyticus]MXN18561.1 hypothetical protein [Pseudooceanicola albus]